MRSRVLLGNGVRFEGSLCATKEEAAESVASVALLNLVREREKRFI